MVAGAAMFCPWGPREQVLHLLCTVLEAACAANVQY
jgi:hypothetical protein